MRSILSLDEWCYKNNTSIVVKHGKLRGFGTFDYAMMNERTW